jgi:hypothetical protein
MSVEILYPDGQPVKEYGIEFGTKPVFSLYIGSEEAPRIFNSTTNYTFVVTHLPTGVGGRTALSYDNGEDDTETSEAPVNISNNAGRSLWPAIAAQGDDVYAAWADDTAAAGQSEILFAKSSDGGPTFSSTIALSESELFAHKPDIAVSNDNVYVVWEDHNLDEQAAMAFRSSSDGSETFGDTTILGNHDGEGLDPQVVVALGSEIYVAWISRAFEEFAGNLTPASSSDGGDMFDLMTVDGGNNAIDVATAARSGGSLYLAWQQHSLRDVTEGNDDTNMFATFGRSDLQVLLEEADDGLQGMTIYSMSAIDSAVYAVGIDSSGTVVLAKSNDGGETFGEMANMSSSGGSSYFPSVAASGSNAYVAWVDNTAEEGNSEVLVVSAAR